MNLGNSSVNVKIGQSWLAYFLLFLWPALVQAQEAVPIQKVKRVQIKEIDLLYTFSSIGHKLSLNYNHFFGRHAVTVGTHLHLNTTIHNKNNRFDGWSFYTPYSGIHKFGLNLGYKFQLLKKPKPQSLHPYLFYQFQPNFSMWAKNRELQITSGPYAIMENTIGIGIQPKLYEQLYFNGSVGGGFSQIYEEGNILSSVTRRFTERAIIFRFGLTYRLAGQP